MRRRLRDGFYSEQIGTDNDSLSLSLLTAGVAESAKLLLQKTPRVDAEQGVVYEPISTAAVDLASVEVLAEYRTMLLVEVPDGAVDQVVATFDAGGIPAWHRPEYDEIAINGYRFASGSTPDLPPELCHTGAVEDEGLYLVQVVGPIRGEWHEEFERAGEIVAYYPENTFLVRGNGGRIEALLELGHVQHVSRYEPAFKVHRELLEARSATQVIVQMDGAQELSGVTTALGALTDQQVSYEPAGPRRNAMVTATRAQILDLARRPEVLWIEPARGIKLSDERVAKIAAGELNVAGDRPIPVAIDENDPGLGRDESESYLQWLSDQGFCKPGESFGCIETFAEHVALLDIGLDDNKCESHGSNCLGPNDTHDRHADFTVGGVQREERFFCVDSPPGVNWCYDYGQQRYIFSDEWSVTKDHGTRVASIIAGDAQGTQSQDGLLYYKGAGMVPEAKIVVGRLANKDGYLLDPFTPAYLESLVSQTFTTGEADTASNSWQQVDAHEYTTVSQKADELVRDADGGFDDDNPMTIVWSAGNFNDQYDDYAFVEAPANAKNVITVGASWAWESDAETAAGSRCEDCDDPPYCAWSLDDIHDYSRRGFVNSPPDKLDEVPYDWKPDLVAPAMPSLAADSMATEAVSTYECFSGTSAAAPVVTGGAILLRRWFHETYGSVPSPAMVKAMLVAHASDLYGHWDYLQDELLPHSPSVAQGWGRIDLGNVFATSAANTYIVDETAVLEPDEYYSVEIERISSEDPVIVAMAYSDCPAAPNATDLLVNTLVLRVIDLDRAGSYIGNDFWPNSWYSRYIVKAPETYDLYHNVKVVRILPEKGTRFLISVVAFSIGGDAIPPKNSMGEQDFALYVVNGTPSS